MRAGKGKRSTTVDLSANLLSSPPSSRSSRAAESGSAKRSLTEALQLARAAVILDNGDNPDGAIEPSIANEYRENRKEFEKNAKDWVKRYAK